jgi:peptidylprolyl isomerase
MQLAECAATAGATVRLRYTIRVDESQAYPPSGPDDTIEVRLGSTRVLPGVERALEGMRAGETKSVFVPAALAFGPRHPERKLRVPHGAAGTRLLRAGDAVLVAGSAGAEFPAIVEDVDAASILVDANHPLSGRDLTFEIHVLDVIPPPRDAGLAD